LAPISLLLARVSPPISRLRRARPGHHAPPAPTRTNAAPTCSSMLWPRDGSPPNRIG